MDPLRANVAEECLEAVDELSAVTEKVKGILRHAHISQDTLRSAQQSLEAEKKKVDELNTALRHSRVQTDRWHQELEAARSDNAQLRQQVAALQQQLRQLIAPGPHARAEQERGPEPGPEPEPAPGPEPELEPEPEPGQEPSFWLQAAGEGRPAQPAAASFTACQLPGAEEAQPVLVSVGGCGDSLLDLMSALCHHEPAGKLAELLRPVNFAPATAGQLACASDGLDCLDCSEEIGEAWLQRTKTAFLQEFAWLLTQLPLSLRDVGRLREVGKYIAGLSSLRTLCVMIEGVGDSVDTAPLILRRKHTREHRTVLRASRTMPERRVQLLAAMLWLSVGGRASALPYLRLALQQLLQQSDRHLLDGQDVGHSLAGCTRLQLFTVLLYQDAAATREDATRYTEKAWAAMQLRVTRHAVVANIAGKDMQIEVDSRGQEVTPTPPLPSCLTRGGATGQPGALYWRFF